MRRASLVAAAVVLCMCLTTAARGAQSVKLTATLTPERLGHGTTIGFGFQIAAPAGRVPPPLTELDLRYPSNFGITLSGLGLASCTTATLEVSGPGGCPPDSRMGFGSALAEIQFGPEIVQEPGDIAVLSGPVQNGHLALLFWANGLSPVNAQLVFPGLLLPAAPPFGGRVDVDVPLIPSLPQAPDVAIVSLNATIGPSHLTYYEELNGRIVAYKPTGILLPKRCPRSGFQFAASFAFLDGSHASARTVVPCPRSRSKARRTRSKH